MFLDVGRGRESRGGRFLLLRVACGLPTMAERWRCRVCVVCSCSAWGKGCGKGEEEAGRGVVVIFG